MSGREMVTLGEAESNEISGMVMAKGNAGSTF